MRVTLLCGDRWHSVGAARESISPLCRRVFEFCAAEESGSLVGSAAVLLCRSGETSRAIHDYVENGGGLLAVHAGVCAGEGPDALDSLLGCRFVFHPCECPVLVQPLLPHPVTRGTQAFCEVDEHYQIELFTPDAQVFLASGSPAQGSPELYEREPYFNTPARVCPAGYTRTHGKGRVCVLTPGHFPAVWNNEQYTAMLENALRWCAGEELAVA
jgi:type 1 glutamine amidotransferase